MMAVESRDCANKEQLAIVVRYVDTNSEAKEKFLKFDECDQGVIGADIMDKILDTLKVVGIDMNLWRGQGYDGGGNMSGIHKGADARITLEYPLSLYFHCSCHRLNLCVPRTCTVQLVRNGMDQISYFFNYSPKRQGCLKDYIETHQPSSKTFVGHVGLRELMA